MSAYSERVDVPPDGHGGGRFAGGGYRVFVLTLEHSLGLSEQVLEHRKGVRTGVRTNTVTDKVRRMIVTEITEM